MVFSSLYFLFLFFPLTLLFYFAVPRVKGKNLVLVIASLIFYAWGEPVWVLLLIFSAVLDYFNSHMIEKTRGTRLPKLFLTLSVVINLSLLGVFKYSGFLLSTLNEITGLALPVPSVALPIGISFYTFQTMSYTIDVYRGKVKAQPSFLNFLLFVSLFPQLIAGPIVRYTDIADQLDRRRVTVMGFSRGLTRFLTGLGKKVLLANYAGQLVSSLLDGDLTQASVLGVWGGVLCYTLQIYFDFSGYSDMAIGLGHMFGFTYPENFNYPYLSRSITEFWRRWHITLSSFFRDYVYIPLGGSRVNVPRHILNLLVVWALTGLWHGASWNFVLWGLYYFVFLVLEKYVWGRALERAPAVIRHLYALLIILFGWVLFYFNSLPRLGAALSVMFGLAGRPLLDPVQTTLLGNNLPFLLLAVVACLPVASLVKGLLASLSRKNEGFGVLTASLTVCYNVLMLFLCVAALAGSGYNPFLYFNF